MVSPKLVLMFCFFLALQNGPPFACFAQLRPASPSFAQLRPASPSFALLRPASPKPWASGLRKGRRLIVSTASMWPELRICKRQPRHVFSCVFAFIYFALPSVAFPWFALLCFARLRFALLSRLHACSLACVLACLLSCLPASVFAYLTA